MLFSEFFLLPSTGCVWYIDLSFLFCYGDIVGETLISDFTLII